MFRSLLAQAGMLESLAVDSRGPTLSAGPGRPSGAGIASCEGRHSTRGQLRWQTAAPVCLRQQGFLLHHWAPSICVCSGADFPCVFDEG